jgi:enoyl-CoA hydratase
VASEAIEAYFADLGADELVFRDGAA